MVRTETSPGSGIRFRTFSGLHFHSAASYLDFESSFEAAGEETPEGADQRCKSRERDAVYLEGIHPDRFLQERERIGHQAQEEEEEAIGKSVNHAGRKKGSLLILHVVVFTLCRFRSSPGRPGCPTRDTYPANDRPKHRRDVVLLQLEQLRRLAVHHEAVGVVVELHRAHEAPVSRHHVRQLQGEKTEGISTLSPALIKTSKR